MGMNEVARRLAGSVAVCAACIHCSTASTNTAGFAGNDDGGSSPTGEALAVLPDGGVACCGLGTSAWPFCPATNPGPSESRSCPGCPGSDDSGLVPVPYSEDAAAGLYCFLDAGVCGIYEANPGFGGNDPTPKQQIGACSVCSGLVQDVNGSGQAVTLLWCSPNPERVTQSTGPSGPFQCLCPTGTKCVLINPLNGQPSLGAYGAECQ